jgi:hypothetical protein
MKNRIMLAAVTGAAMDICAIAHVDAEPAAAHREMLDSMPERPVSSQLVQKVRRATEQFKDIDVALNEGWVQGTPCVSGPDYGAMGVHFV